MGYRLYDTNMKNIPEKVNEIERSIKTLAFHGYTIIDLENNIIDKWNINNNKTHNISYNRLPKNT